MRLRQQLHEREAYMEIQEAKHQDALDELRAQIRFIEGSNKKLKRLKKKLERRNKTMEGRNKIMEGRNKIMEGRNKIMEVRVRDLEVKLQAANGSIFTANFIYAFVALAIGLMAGPISKIILNLIS